MSAPNSFDSPVSMSSPSTRTMIRSRVDRVDDPAALAEHDGAGVAGDDRPRGRCRRSAPRLRSSGTAWRCMFEPISARLASSCSRNGISAAATDTSCFGLMSM